MTLQAIRFLDVLIEPIFDTEPLRAKTPACPDGFVWDGEVQRVVELLSEWKDFERRGRSARNMQPEHAERAAGRGSLGVGRFYFRVRVSSSRIFDIYFDRAPTDADRRKGGWYLYREMAHKGSSG